MNYVHTVDYFGLWSHVAVHEAYQCDYNKKNKKKFIILYYAYFNFAMTVERRLKVD